MVSRDPRLALTLEYVEGGSLKQHLDGTPMPKSLPPSWSKLWPCSRSTLTSKASFTAIAEQCLDGRRVAGGEFG